MTDPTQAPPPHASPTVHAFPSSHGSVLALETQPMFGKQVSVVQGLESLQTTRGPA
jgi:hypothetical protein